ncbi:sporulation integral membrane protein YtvI [Paenibacillus aurantius]|uniref:Sporulation integral membrane protein YtvI n=1 Tax=Paenibacillus aurantius TaxID=2918900 RepID=A0AA96LD50_9BACL|nr:sporulation integral membrane protein YtvI [Paenibacillus aurantius]WNQ09980.1 sporulation integral membrane protein YtvI [Paenibacillus aurantius]
MSIKSLITIVLGLLLLYGFFTYGAPFLLALVFAILLEPLVQLVMRFNRIKRPLASMLICTLFTLVLIGFIYGIGAKIVFETASFVKSVPTHWTDPDGLIQQATDSIKSMVASFSPQLADQLETGLGSTLRSLTGIFTGVTGYFLNFAAKVPNLLIAMIVFLLAFYLYSINLPKVKESFLSLFDEQTRPQIDSVLLVLRRAILGFIMAQLILSAITFVLMLVGLMLLKTGYALALAFLVTIVDLLPILGTGSVLVPWAIYEIVMGNTFLGTGLLIMFAVVTVVRRIVEPKVLGNAVGIGSLAALVSLYVGFKLVGVIGLFLGPLVIIIYTALRQVGLLKIRIKLE